MKALAHENPTITVDGVTYNVQRLGLKHLVKFIKILKAAKIVNQFADMVRDIQQARDNVLSDQQAKEGEELDADVIEAATQAALKDRAIGTALNLLFALVEADAEIYQLVAAITGMDEEKAAALPLDVTMELVEIIVDAPDIGAFTKAVQKFLGRKTETAAIAAT